MACACIPETNRLLEEHNTVLVTTMFGGPARAVIATDKANSKIRGRPKIFVATFCPFCGDPYEPQPAKPAPAVSA